MFGIPATESRPKIKLNPNKDFLDVTAIFIDYLHCLLKQQTEFSTFYINFHFFKLFCVWMKNLYNTMLSLWVLLPLHGQLLRFRGDRQNNLQLRHARPWIHTHTVNKHSSSLIRMCVTVFGSNRIIYGRVRFTSLKVPGRTKDSHTHTLEYLINLDSDSYLHTLTTTV